MSMSDETRQQKLVKAWQTGADLTLMALDLFWPEHIRERAAMLAADLALHLPPQFEPDAASHRDAAMKKRPPPHPIQLDDSELWSLCSAAAYVIEREGAARCRVLVRALEKLRDANPENGPPAHFAVDAAHRGQDEVKP